MSADKNDPRGVGHWLKVAEQLMEDPSVYRIAQALIDAYWDGRDDQTEDHIQAVIRKLRDRAGEETS